MQSRTWNEEARDQAIAPTGHGGAPAKNEGKMERQYNAAPPDPVGANSR
jgi:hypothetical protein